MPDEYMSNAVRRRVILAASLELAAERGLVNVDFSKIARKLCISRSLVRYHMRNREEFYKAVSKFALTQGHETVIADAKRLGYL